MLLRLWRRFESWSFALPLLFVAYTPNWLLAPRLYLTPHFSWVVVAFWMMPLTLLAHSIPLACLGTWLLRRSLPEHFVRRLILVTVVLALPLQAAIVHFYIANPLCSRD